MSSVIAGRGEYGCSRGLATPKLDEARYVTEMVRGIVALVLMQSELGGWGATQ